MNDIVNIKKGHNIVNDTVKDKKGSQYCEQQTALLISQMAYLLSYLLSSNLYPSFSASAQDYEQWIYLRKYQSLS